MTARFIVADVFDGLATLEDGSVDLVVTSPPFLALRSYLPADHADKSKEIGSEATPAEFIDVMLKVTAELRRVLAPHGSICVELGDTYAGHDNRGSGEDNGHHDVKTRVVQTGEGWPLSKSRTLIPSLYEIALAYGVNPLTGQESPAGQWRIRNIVTWARPNPPVGALGDKWRPATSDLIVACTSSKRYWDDLATRRPHKYPELVDVPVNTTKPAADGSLMFTDRTISHRGNTSGAPLLDWWEIPLLEGEEPTPYGPNPTRPETERPKHERTTEGRQEFWDGGEGRFGVHEAGAPLLDYWVIPPGGYQGAHYAVFPPELVEPCIKAMCPRKVCRVCGEPSRRIVEMDDDYRAIRDDIIAKDDPRTGMLGYDKRGGTIRPSAVWNGTGWSDCGHDDWRPGLVLDPFVGSGTTLAVATGHGHDAIGIDIDQRNYELTVERVGPFLMELV